MRNLPVSGDVFLQVMYFLFSKDTSKESEQGLAFFGWLLGLFFTCT